MFDKIKAYGWMLAALGLGLAAAIQSYRYYTEAHAHGELIVKVAKDAQDRAQAALKHEQKTGGQERTHGAATQENSDAFTTSAPVRDAIARVDLAVHNRMLNDSERRTASYRAMAQACAASSSDIAGRFEALDRQLVSGAGVVKDLRRDLTKRDAEVALLYGQIMADRKLFQQPAPEPESPQLPPPSPGGP